MAALAPERAGGDRPLWDPACRWVRLRRDGLWRWYLHSPFQTTWLRLAIQAGVCALLILAIFSTPAVWRLHTFDIVLANPVMVLVMANLGILFQANTGLPAAKIGFESVVGAVAGSAMCYAVVYAAYGANGGSHDPSPTKAAVSLALGAACLAAVTAARFRWPQHVLLAGLLCNLTLAVGVAVTYYATARLWRFLLYWLWFVGLSQLFMVAVATFVLPLPAGWVVRKQLSRALRQEGAVLEAVVRLMTEMEPDGGSGGSTKTSAPLGEAASEAGLQQQQQQQQHTQWVGDEGDDFSPPRSEDEQPQGGEDDSPLVRAHRWLCRRWRAARLRRVPSLARMQASLRSISLSGRRGAVDDHHAARALGIRPDLYPACEPIYRMSGPTAASLQAAWVHLRYTAWELDFYRPTLAFPSLPFHRLLLLARTVLSCAMMMIYPLQTGDARLGASRVHAAPLQQVAAAVRGCCHALAAVIRDNEAVAPALQQLDAMEQAFWGLQHAVGHAATHVAAEGDAESGEATAAQDELAMHLAMSMLFTCCTRVRAMFQLLPEAVAADQPGVAEAVAAHFAVAHAWHAVLHARTAGEVASPRRDAQGVYRRSQLLWNGQQAGAGASLRASRSAAALSRLVTPAVHVAEPAAAQDKRSGFFAHCARLAQRGFACIERWTGFTRNQVSLGLQMAAAFVVVMFLVVVPAVYEALARRSVWAVFIVVVVHEPLQGSVVWKAVLRWGGTLVAGALGLAALYFSCLCNGLSFDNRPAKFVAMTAALVAFTMPLAAGTARFGLQHAYFFIVSCLLMYTVALPGYALDEPMPVLALWRIACTALGIAVELLVAVAVCPVTARDAAHAAAAGALRGMADVAGRAFLGVLPPASPPDLPPSPLAKLAEQPAPAHTAVAIAPPCAAGGWQGDEVAHGAVLTRIYQPMWEAYNSVNALRNLLGPLRVEYHPCRRPARFPVAAGRRAQRLCRRMLNALTCFALAMDAHHVQSVPLLEPHASELGGLVAQLREALHALAAMVAGGLSLESAARAVAALEQHAQALMLRVLLSGPPPGLRCTDAAQGLAFLAMLFSVASVARLLCLALGEAFCAADADGLAAAAELLAADGRGAAEGRLQAVVAELMSEALGAEEEEEEEEEGGERGQEPAAGVAGGMAAAEPPAAGEGAPVA